MPNLITGNLNPDLFVGNEPDCIIDDGSATLPTVRIDSGWFFGQRRQKTQTEERETGERKLTSVHLFLVSDRLLSVLSFSHLGQSNRFLLINLIEFSASGQQQDQTT